MSIDASSPTTMTLDNSLMRLQEQIELMSVLQQLSKDSFEKYERSKLQIKALYQDIKSTKAHIKKLEHQLDT